MKLNVRRTFTTIASTEAVFAFLADFRNAETWDPGTVECSLISGEVGPGATYRNVSEFLGRKTELTYVTLTHEPVIAVDLRNQMREQLAKGASEREVREFMVARYGDFVLYRPPFKTSTAALWIGPFALLLAGLVVLVRRLRSRRAPEPALSPAERERAAKLLE